MGDLVIYSKKIAFWRDKTDHWINWGKIGIQENNKLGGNLECKLVWNCELLSHKKTMPRLAYFTVLYN